QKVIGSAVKSVGARFRRDIDLSRAPAQLRGIGVRHDLEFLNLIYGRDGRECVEVRLCIASTIQKEIRVLRAGAPYRVLDGYAPADLPHLLEGFHVALGESHAGG